MEGGHPLSAVGFLRLVYSGVCVWFVLLRLLRLLCGEGIGGAVVEGAVRTGAAASSRAGPRAQKGAEAVVLVRGWENGPPGTGGLHSGRVPGTAACTEPRPQRLAAASSPQPRGMQAGCPLWARGRASGQAPLRQKE